MTKPHKAPTRRPAWSIDFGFIIHPPSLADVRRVMPATRLMPDGLVRSMLKRQHPYVVSRIRHLRSRLGHDAEGCFIACPLLPRQMLDLDQDLVLGRIVAAARIAERLGARIVGLGGYTSVVGDKGFTVAQSVGIAVTSGNALTAWSAVEALRRLAARTGRDIAGMHLAVIGASGSIGSVCAHTLASEVGGTTITARNRDRLEDLRRDLAKAGAPNVEVETDIARAIARARLIITTTSAPSALFDIADLLPGSIVVDVSVPRNVSVRDNPRPDVIVVDGGRIRVPAGIKFSVDLGLPRGVVHACMAETMALALEGRYENFSLGDRLEPARVDAIGTIAERHGFEIQLPEGPDTDELRPMPDTVPSSALPC